MKIVRNTELLPGDGVAEGGSARRLSGRLVSVGSWLTTWLDTWADHWAAAEMYQQLSVLSDAELARRGLSHATLARDVLAATTPPHDWRTASFNGVSLRKAVWLGM